MKNLPLPDGHEFDGPTGAILWAEAEAAQALNLERATNWKFPLDKIYTPFPSDPLLDINLNEPSHLGNLAYMAELPEVKLVVVDSLSGANLYKKESDTEVMKITAKLAALARDLQKPIVRNHLNKKREFDLDEITLDRVKGSSGIVQHARVIWAVDTPD